MTDRPDIDAIEARANAATPGPWAWVLGSHGTVRLSAMHSGMLTVMDFVRRGMNGAVARFSAWEGWDAGEARGRRGGVMRTVEQLLGPEENAPLLHPDAVFIAHARTDILALVAEVRRLTRERDAETERCAKLADTCVDKAKAQSESPTLTEMGVGYFEGRLAAASEIAAAIRGAR